MHSKLFRKPFKTSNLVKSNQMAKPAAARGQKKGGGAVVGGCSFQIGTLVQRVSTPPPPRDLMWGEKRGLCKWLCFLYGCVMVTSHQILMLISANKSRGWVGLAVYIQGIWVHSRPLMSRPTHLFVILTHIDSIFQY